MGIRSDQRGSVTVITALSVTGLLGAAAIGLDLRVLYKAQRRAQGAADLAALNAASDPASAEAAARRALADNGFSDAARIEIRTGSYLRSAALPEASRFTTAAASPNAVRVNLSAPVRLTFGRFVGLPAALDVAVTSTAANTRFAAFSLGSGVAALDAGIANAVLGAMLGTRLSLTLLDFNALLSARVDAFRVLDALATDIGLQAASYTDIIAASATPGQILDALAVSAASTSSATAGSVLGRLGQAVPRSASRIPLRGIIDLGDAENLSPERGRAGPAIRLFDVVSAAAALANGDRQVAVDLAGSVPGLVATRLTLAVGERRQSSGWVAPGSARATLRTGQVRLLIETQIRAPLNLGTIALPLYAEAGSAQDLIEDSVVLVEHKHPDEGRGHTRNHHREHDDGAEDAPGRQHRIQQDSERQPDAHTERHDERREQRRIERRLPEDRITGEACVVVEADEDAVAESVRGLKAQSDSPEHRQEEKQPEKNEVGGEERVAADDLGDALCPAAPTP